jgi:hypothetical protein
VSRLLGRLRDRLSALSEAQKLWLNIAAWYVGWAVILIPLLMLTA